MMSAKFSFLSPRILSLALTSALFSAGAKPASPAGFVLNVGVPPLGGPVVPASRRLPVSSTPRFPLASTILGPSKPKPAEKEKPIDRVQAAEITDATTGRRIDKFLQLVLLPLGLVITPILS